MKKIINQLLMITYLLVIIFSCDNNKGAAIEWEIVYKNDKNGNTIMGSKSELINFIRQGSPIRIGWGVKGKNHSIEHIGTPIWLAILDEKEVIAHLDPQILSVTDWNDLSAAYSDSTKLKEEWRVVISTNGEFDAVWYDKKEHIQLKRRPQKHAVTWFAKGFDESIKKVKPLFEE